MNGLMGSQLLLYFWGLMPGLACLGLLVGQRSQTGIFVLGVKSGGYEHSHANRSTIALLHLMADN